MVSSDYLTIFVCESQVLTGVPGTHWSPTHSLESQVLTGVPGTNWSPRYSLESQVLTGVLGTHWSPRYSLDPIPMSPAEKAHESRAVVSIKVLNFHRVLGLPQMKNVSPAGKLV